MPHEDRSAPRDDLEQLLGGAALDDAAVTELLWAATAPAQPGELAGFDAALAAFRSVPVVQAVNPHRRRRVVVKTFASGLLATKVLAGAVGAAAVGGVALAAGTGHLGHSATAHRLTSTHAAPIALPAHPRTHAHPVPASTSPSTRPITTPTTAHTTPPTARPTPTTHPRPTTHPKTGPLPRPALVGLCRMWVIHEKQHSQPIGHKTPFTVLIRKAGGPRAIDTYCTAVLAGYPSHGRSSGKPIARPTYGRPVNGQRHVRPTPTPYAYRAPAPS